MTNVNRADQEDPNLEFVERTISYYDMLNDQGQHVSVPLVTVPQCHVCRHPQRIFIENAIFKGHSYKSVVDRLEDPESLNWWNIKRHYENGHAPLHQQAVLETIWKRALAEGVTPEEYEANQATEVAAIDLVVDKFYHALKDPEFRPDMREGLTAAKMLHEMKDRATEGYDPNDMFIALSIFINHTRTILTRYAPTEFNQAMSDLQRLLDTDPVLKRIAMKMEREEEEAAVGMLDARDDDDNFVEDAVVLSDVPLLERNYIPLDAEDNFDEPDDE